MVTKLKIQLLLEISKGLRALHRLPVIPWVSVALVMVFVLSFLLSVAPKVQAADGIRQTINFQGKLVDQNGLNVPDNNYTVVFTLYNDPSAGSNLWDETQTVSTVDGVFQVELGSVDTTLGNVNFNSDLLYLGIKVGADAEMTPRIRFTAVPYAFNAKKVNGLNVTNTSGNPFATATTLQIAEGKTVTISNGLTLAGTDSTTITFQGTDTYVGRATTDTLTNKTIGTTGLTFSGAGTDITTGTNEDFTFALNGSGDLVINSDFDSGVSIGSASNTPAPLSISGGIGSNAALIINQTNSGDLFVASSAGTAMFGVTNAGGLRLGSSEGSSGNCLLSGGNGVAATWGACSQGGSTTPDTVRFVDVNPAAFADNDTTELFNDTPRPNITTDSTTAPVLIAVQIRGDVSNTTADAFLAARVVYTTNGSAPSCSTSPQAGQAMIGGFTTNTTHPWQVVGTFIHTPGVGGLVRYTVCTSALSVGTVTDTPEAVEISLSELGNSNSNWTLSNGVYVQNSPTADVLMGGVASSSAKFAILNMNPTSGTPTASLSAGLSGGAYLTAAGLLQTTANQSLTLGGNTTGNVLINPQGINYVGIGTANPLAALDVRTSLHTGPSASISANSSYATMVVDNRGTGELLTASSSGETKFAILNNGALVAGQDAAGTIRNGLVLPNTLAHFSGNINSYGQVNVQNRSNGNSASSDFVATADNGNDTTNYVNFGINSSGYSNPAFTIVGANDGYLYNNGGNLAIGTQTAGKILKLHTAGTLAANERVRIDENGNFGFNTNITNRALFDIRGVGINSLSLHLPVASVSGLSTAVAMVVDNNGTGDIFTASKSGATKFTVLNSGDLRLANYSTGGGFLYTNTTGTVLQTLAGNSGECLKSAGGATPTWGACSGASAGYWELQNGLLYNGNITTDFAIGGTTSASAKLKVSMSKSQPTASISADSLIAGLIVDNINSGALFTASKSGDTKFAIMNNGALVAGPDAGGTIRNNLVLPNTLAHFSGNVNSYGQVNVQNRSNGNAASSDFVATADNGSDTTNYINFGINSSGYSDAAFSIGSANDGYLYNNGGNLAIGTQSTGRVIKFHTAGTLAANERLRIDENGKLGFNTTTTNRALFDIRGVGINTLSPHLPVASISGQTVSAAMIVDNNGTGDIFHASKSGATKFAVLNSGDVRITNLNSATCDVKSGTNGVLFCGTDATGAGGGTNFLNLNNGSFSFINNTADILIGGPATSSAKFAFMNLNSNSGLDPLASFSGTLRLGAKNNSTVTQQTTWTKISQTTPGTIANGGTANIASISAMTSYNGSVYVGTYGTNAGTAEVYRYDGTNANWTKVSQTTAGQIASGGTQNIASVSAMTVYDGRLYVGTSKINEAELYRYDGGTTWVKVSGVAGTFGTVTAQDGVSALAVYNGALFLGTREGNAANAAGTGARLLSWNSGVWTPINTTAGQFVTTNTVGVHAVSNIISFNNTLFLSLSKAGDSDVVRYTGGTGASVFLSMNTANLTGGFIINGAATNTYAADEITSMVVFNNTLIIGTRKNNAADILSLNYSPVATTANQPWIRLNHAVGQLASGETGSIDQISSMIVYNGMLYLGTREVNAAEIYRYTGGGQRFMKVSQAAGTIASGGTSSIDGVVKLLQHNGDLYAGTMELGRAEVYKHTSSIDRSYGLEFVANPQIAGGAQNGNLNSASIFYLASASANLGSNNGNTGAFIFSHGIQTRNGSYDVAEDYPTRDETLEPGDVVTIDQNERGFVKKSESANDYSVIGVFSADPALRLSQADAHIDGARAVPIALAGRVGVKVSTESGAIKPGDYLTASSKPGVAMKAVKSGGVIGQAMESYGGEGVGKVLTYIKSASYQGSIASNFAGFEVRPEREGQDLLAAIATQTPKAAVSEIVTDKLIAGLRIVSPEIIADKLQIRTIEAVNGTDIGIILQNEGTLSVKNASGEASMTFTGAGDAYFAGHVQARTISADKLLINDIVIDANAWQAAFSEGGLESIASKVKQQEELLKSQESRIVSLENLFASQSASIVTPTPFASDAATVTLLATMPAIEDFERTKAKDYAFTNMPTDGLATFSGKLAADRLQVTGSAIIEGILHVVEVLTARTLIVDDLASFLGKVVFSGDVFFEGRPTFNNDTAGIAVIKKGTDRIAVRFEKEYTSAPMVNVNLTLDEVSPMPSEEIESLTKRQEALEQRVFNSNVRYLISKRTNKGFVILLDKKADEDIAFSWIVVAVDSPLVHKEIGDNFTSVSGTDSKNAQPITTSIPTIIPTSSIEKREAQILPSPKEVSDGDPPHDEAKEGGDAP